MNRRNAIRNIGIGAGITISAGALATLFSSCQSEMAVEKDNWKPQFLAETDASLLDELSDIILPATDTPGAKEAKVVRYMDMMIKNIYKAEDQEAFNLGLTGFKNLLQKEQEVEPTKAKRKHLAAMLDKHMVNLSEEQLAEAMKLLNSDAPDPKAEGAAEHPYYITQFLASLRNLTIAGYFGSELIATNHLNYLPVPGPYQGCIPLEEVDGKAWAL